MTIRNTSLLALGKSRKNLPNDQAAVLAILEEIGPAHDLRILEALNQKEQATLKPKREKRIWTINSVCGRRNELIALGLMIDMGPHRGFWKGQKKLYHIWRVCGDLRKPVGWKSITVKISQSQSKILTQQQRQHIHEIQEQVTKPIAHRLTASEAGRVLVEHRRNYRKTTKPTKQQLLFV